MGGEIVLDEQNTYYEAIFVKAGQVVADINNRLPNRGKVTDVVFSAQGSSKTRGVISQDGFSKWIPESITGILGNVFSKPPTLPEVSGWVGPADEDYDERAGAFSFSLAPPRGWDDGVGGVERSVDARWDCCGSDNATILSVKPKLTPK